MNMSFGLFAITLVVSGQPDEIRPKGLDGHLLNLDFETNDLRDWTVEGKVFEAQPIEGDTVAKPWPDIRGRHQGRFWLGGYEKLKDQPVGTLTSAPFAITHTYASFLLGGGPHPEARVEILGQDSGMVIHRVSGVENEAMARAVVDLMDHVGKVARVRVVDKHKGHWGHINFDHFPLHATRPAGEIIGATKGLKRNTFLDSELRLDDFHLAFEVELSPDGENSGVQFRCALLPGGEMAGLLADIGTGWWGKLHEERGRGLSWPKSGEAHGKPGGWNAFAIEARGSGAYTSTDGQPCVDLADEIWGRFGQVGFQLHSGGNLEARCPGFNTEPLTP